MGRQSSHVEFLNILWKMSAKTKGEFAKACGKTPGNMGNYLSGKLQPGMRVLQSALRHQREWDVSTIQEIQEIPKNLNSLPATPGIYVIYDSGGNVLYIGKATSMRAEVRQTLGRAIPVPIRFGPTLKKAHLKIRQLAKYLSLYRVPSSRMRHNLEVLLLRIFANQTHNTNIGTLT